MTSDDPLHCLDLHRVTKNYGGVRALHAVSLSVRAGEVVAVLGPNGAGKSTLLSILATQTAADTGDLLRNGAPVDKDFLRRRTGYLSHAPLVYPDLSGEENLTLFARLAGVADAAGAVKTVTDALDLRGFAHRPVRLLSRGQLQRIALARALVTDPELLLLDEPTTGLDAASTDRITASLRAHRENGGATVLVSHDPWWVSQVATSAVCLRKGHVRGVHDGPFSAQDVNALLGEVA